MSFYHEDATGLNIDFPDDEFRVETPSVFDGMPWIQYGETRRSNPITDPLGGNVAQSDLVIDNTYNLLRPNMDRNTFMSTERSRADRRISTLMALLSLEELARPRPEHSTRLITDEQFAQVRSTREDRTPADAMHTRVEQRGIMFSPADCPLVIIADPTKDRHSLTVIHAGYKGLGKDIIGSALDQLDIKRKEAHVFITPHALKGFQVYGEPLVELESSAVTREHLGPSDTEGKRSLNFGSAIIARLIELELDPHHIEVSSDNSLTDPTLYSQRNWRQKGANGRNAVMVGIC